LTLFELNMAKDKAYENENKSGESKAYVSESKKD